jgi:hypothetical protein
MSDAVAKVSTIRRRWQAASVPVGLKYPSLSLLYSSLILAANSHGMRLIGTRLQSIVPQKDSHWLRYHTPRSHDSVARSPSFYYGD